MNSLISNVLELPLEERLQCMEELWESMRQEDLDSPSWHQDVLSQRKREIEEGTAEIISGDELRRRLREGK